MGKDEHGEFAYSRKMTSTEAQHFPYVKANGPRGLKYLCFDFDRPIGPDDFSRAKVPLHNIISRDPVTGKAHALYELEKPVYKKKTTDTRPGEALPVIYYNRVLDAMRRSLQSDIAFHGSLIKNPLHSKWETLVPTDHPYTLGELSECLDLTTRHRKISSIIPLEEAYEGIRQHTLFEHLRRFAYTEKEHHRSEDSFRIAVEHQAQLMNGLIADPLSDDTVYSTATAVAKWTWKNYTGHRPDNRRRGIMNLDSNLPIHVRQQMGQDFSAGVKIDRTDEKIVNTIITLHSKGLKLTKTNIARCAQVNRVTVYRHWPTVVALLPNDLKALFQPITKRSVPSALTLKLNSTSSPVPYTTESDTFKCHLSVEGLSKRDNEIFAEAVSYVSRITGCGRAPLADLVIAMQIKRKKKMRPVTIEKIKASEFYRDDAIWMTREQGGIPKAKVKDTDLEMTNETIFSNRHLNDDEILVHGVFVVRRRKEDPPPIPSATEDEERKAKVAAVMANFRAKEQERMGYGIAR